jgi:hypothetical protein
MNSFRSLVYLPYRANATRVFCRDSGLVQGDFPPGMAFGCASRCLGHSPRWNEKAGVDGMRYAPGYATCGAKETSHEKA